MKTAERETFAKLWAFGVAPLRDWHARPGVGVFEATGLTDGVGRLNGRCPCCRHTCLRSGEPASSEFDGKVESASDSEQVGLTAEQLRAASRRGSSACRSLARAISALLLVFNGLIDSHEDGRQMTLTILTIQQLLNHCP
ncbi:hypothetical protein ROHU_018752 [Labeo rohita]|uniref:Uncharacterized protein n=1 Tax=Labeo rohita TaxID=84645 RepID=A0A498N9N6_LABRO|nr:hypothetical protein ROHU_018752 [Labeo rohita]